MPEFLQGMASQLAGDIVNPLVYLAIIVVFVTAMLKCVAPMLNTRRILRRATRMIRQGENSKRSWQEQNFLGKGVLHEHWSEYLNNLFFADGEFHNPSSVEDFINEETAIYGPGRSQLAEAAPSIMVSLGFLGTLLGISMGLRGFSMDNAEQVMAAIRQLVPGMQYAFMTSIVGVVASVITTLTTRIVSGSAQSALNNFYVAMKQNAGVISVEPMTQIAIYQQEQTALIQNLVHDLSGALAERMAEQMASAVSRSLGGMQRSLDEFMSYATREQLRGIDIVVQRFIHELNMSMNSQFEHLSNTIEETCNSQREMGETVHKAMDGFGRVLNNIAQASQLSDAMMNKLDAFVGKMNQNAQQADEAYQRVSASVEHMDLVARQQNNYLQSISKLQSEVIKSLERFETASQRFMETFTESAQQSSTAMQGAASAIKQSGDVLASNHKALTSGIAKDIDRTYNNFFKSTNESIEHMAWLIDDVKNTVARLPETIDNAAGLYSHQAERLSEALRRMQAALDDAVERLMQARYTNR